jgi:hypothetical protein
MIRSAQLTSFLPPRPWKRFLRDFYQLASPSNSSNHLYFYTDLLNIRKHTQSHKFPLKMSAANGSAMQVDNADGKGKGKATEPNAHEISMDEDSSSDEEVDEVSAKSDCIGT